MKIDCFITKSPLFKHFAPLGCVSKPKTKKMMYDLAETEEFDREEIATYEEVARLFPRPGSYRPIILVGPPGTDFFQPSLPRPPLPPSPPPSKSA
jgi:hypothetical protein